MRKVDLRLDLVGRRTARTCQPRSIGFRCRTAQFRAYLVRLVLFQRTGVGLLLGDPNFRQYIENGLALDFQLSCQIVDSNLTHPPFLFLRLIR
jgi:hypothetical protein